jgi:(2Fe-2S) ferredoxin
MADRGLDGEISVRGGLCHGKCKQGPNLTIDNVNYTRVDPNVCLDLLNRHCAKVDAL